MLLMNMVFMSGCSLCQTKTVYVKAKEPTFVIPDVNITTPPPFKPKDIEVIDENTTFKRDGTEVKTSLKTMLKSESISKFRGLEAYIYKESFFSLVRQIMNYRERVKGEGDGQRKSKK